MDAAKTTRLRSVETTFRQAASRSFEQFEWHWPSSSWNDTVTMLSLVAIVGIVVFLAFGG